jgi:UDP-glucose 4-epimerase
MTTHVLITGGLGYLGGRIALSLSKDASTNVRITSRRQSSEQPDWAKSIEIVNLDFDSDVPIQDSCAGIDTIIHLAALNAADCANNPARAERVNVDGTRRLIAAACEAGVNNFIYFSTAHVYASPLSGKIDELTSPKPSHPYAATHLDAEAYVLNTKKINGVVLRLSNVVGAPADKDANCWTLIANELCREAACGKPLALRGDGTDQRDFVCMDDVIKIIKALVDDPSITGAHNIFNVTKGQAIHTLDLANLISDRANHLFGSHVDFHTGESNNKDMTTPLMIKPDRLAAIGIAPTQDIICEIDAALRFCREAFATKM